MIAANQFGWNNSDVAVRFACSDSLSGLAPGTSLPDKVVSSEGAGQSVNGTCSDRAGNSASATVSNINIDKTPPTIAATGTPAANQYGWNDTDVTISFTCSEALSGLATCGPASQVVSTDGANQSRTATATDLAGNTATMVVTAINIDKTGPVLSCSASPDLLWPPNHQLINVTADINVIASLSGSARLVMLSAASNEPDNGLGDGDTPNDIQGWAIGTPALKGLLRAERSGTGGGRIYTLTYSVQDRAGNISTCDPTVVVPHDKPKLMRDRR